MCTATNSSFSRGERVVLIREKVDCLTTSGILSGKGLNETDRLKPIEVLSMHGGTFRGAHPENCKPLVLNVSSFQKV